MPFPKDICHQAVFLALKNWFLSKVTIPAASCPGVGALAKPHKAIGPPPLYPRLGQQFHTYKRRLKGLAGEPT